MSRTLCLKSIEKKAKSHGPYEEIDTAQNALALISDINSVNKDNKVNDTNEGN